MKLATLGFFSILVCLFSYFSATIAFVITQDMVQHGLRITQPGEWTLSESITVSHGTGITVLAEYVILNLNGYVLRTPVDAAVGISVEANNCLIKNGTIEGFSTAGILIDTVDDVQLSHIVLDNNQIGVSVSGSSYVELKHIIFQENGYAGIEIQDSHTVHLVACNVKNSAHQGVIVHKNCLNVVIDASHINNCQSVGLFLDTDGVQCSYVSVQHCGDDGIVIKGKNCVCNSVLSLNNQGSGFVIEGTHPIMRSCKAGYNARDGVTLAETTEEVTIQGGAYALNHRIGINNKGSTMNKVTSAQIYENKKRNVHRVMSVQ